MNSMDDNKKRKMNSEQEDDAQFLQLSGDDALELSLFPRHSSPAEQSAGMALPSIPSQFPSSTTISSLQLFGNNTPPPPRPPPMPFQIPASHPMFVPESSQQAYTMLVPESQASAIQLDEGNPHKRKEKSDTIPALFPWATNNRRNQSLKIEEKEKGDTSSSHPRRNKEEKTIPPPYPWATDRKAIVHSLSYLMQRQISTITGEVQCKRCERKYEMEFDLEEKFREVWTFIAEKKSTMHDRAPNEWMNPILPTCKHCGQENSVKPVIAEKNKKSINWLFLLLGQMLGCLTLEQLKYFCKHTKNHRTGAKNRVLYLTYLGLCKQLDPNGPFDR